MDNFVNISHFDNKFLLKLINLFVEKKNNELASYYRFEEIFQMIHMDCDITLEIFCR